MTKLIRLLIFAQYSAYLNKTLPFMDLQVDEGCGLFTSEREEVSKREIAAAEFEDSS